MQAIWSDYGDIKVQLYSPGDPEYDPLHPSHNYALVTELHNGEAGPGAWLSRWHDVLALNDDGQTMGYDHVSPLAMQTYDYDRVLWKDSPYNSPYKSWSLPDPPPATWDFYRIPPGCHAYTQITGDSELLKAQFEKATEWRLDKPMFIQPAESGSSSNVRIASHGAIIMLEVAWAKRSKNPDGTDAGLVEWKYEYLHFLTPAVEGMGYDSSDPIVHNYDLIPFGQSLSTIAPSTTPSYEHTIQWINIHIYNATSTVLYCPGISLWVS